jgi:hypothetical protein
MGLSR